MSRSAKQYTKALTARRQPASVTQQSTLLKLLNSAVSIPSELLPKNCHKKYVYEHNSREYEKLLTWKAHLLRQMCSFENPSDIPQTMEFELERVNHWIRIYEVWFRESGNGLPNIEPRTKVWARGPQEAAKECIARQPSRAKGEQIRTCRAFMKEYPEIEGKPGYTPEQLSTMVSKVRYETE